MPLAPGTRLGAYEILAPIGAGGMGEVYRARDSRLGREVALKVLPDQFARDPERMGRFEREARLLASLHHPHIATLFGLEHGALAMELVDGPSLSEQMAGGPMPLDEALRIARQIAEGLEAAHERGVIHRDLKPANIKLTREGEVKILDFGLAKALADDTANDPLHSQAATRTAAPAETVAGAVMGTPAYMSPEQAEGKPLDRRVDIWAFGVVLYEMLAARSLFGRETTAETLAAVLTQDAAIDTKLASAPASVRRLIARCVERDPKKRLRDIGEARIAIDDFLAGGGGASDATAALTPTAQQAPWGWIALATLAAIAAGALGYERLTRQPESGESGVFRYQIAPPGEKSSIRQIALSVDGRQLAIAAASSDGKSNLWVRPLDALEARILPGTTGAASPFWSPDGQWIAFFAGNQLKRIPSTGGPAQVLCAVDGGGEDALSGAWSSDGVILFAAGRPSKLSRVASTGGLPAPVNTETREDGVSHPYFLPGGQRYLYATQGTTSQGRLWIGSLSGEPARKLLDRLSPPVYVPAQPGSKLGHLLYLRQTTLLAQPVDEVSMQLAGEPFPVADGMHYSIYSPPAPFAASANGILAFQAAGDVARNQLAWIDRAGKTLSMVGELTRQIGFQLSPDERSVVSSRPGAEGHSDLWLHDLNRRIDTRLTFDPSANSTPAWSPDSRSVAFSSKRTGDYDIYVKDATGGGPDEPVFRSKQYKIVSDWSRDGRFILFTSFQPNPDLWVFTLEGERKAFPYLATGFTESQGQFSPDTKWIALSNESGQAEVYVRPFPFAPGKWQISSNGGRLPRWRRDGKELYYLDANLKLVAVPVKATPGPKPVFEPGAPQMLFDTNAPSVPPFVNWFPYAPSADGSRFLVNTNAVSPGEAPLTVVVNWLSAVEK